MKTPDSEKLLRELRTLNRTMNQATPDAVQVRKFRDLFIELDLMLKNGGKFPTSWITQLNRNNLPTEITHTITDFDPPNDEQLRKRGLAWCGHKLYPTTTHCTSRDCGNHIGKHKTN